MNRLKKTAASLSLVALAGTVCSASSMIASPISAHAATSWVTTENAKPGTTDWNVFDSGNYASADDLAAFADQVSIAQGGSFGLKISNHTGSEQQWLAYRMGYYNGTGGRLVDSGSWSAATPQDAPTKIALTAAGTPSNEVTTDWSVSSTISTANWPVGQYVIVVKTQDGHQTAANIVVRATDNTGRTVMVSAPTTVNMYNRWGGAGGYYGINALTGAYTGADRSRILSFDRPWDLENGWHLWKVMEQGEIQEAEKDAAATGIDLGYTTSYDIATTGASAVAGATATISEGHDEYWSNSEETAYQQIRNAGTNEIFAGSNTMWWRVRYHADGRGYDIYKSTTEDPVTDPTQQTVVFPTNEILSMFGLYYTHCCFETMKDAPSWTVVNPNNFMYAGTGLKQGSTIKGMVRIESDQASDTSDRPANAEVVNHSTFAVNTTGTIGTSDTVYYTVSSGAGVLSYGTMGMSIALSTLDSVHTEYYFGDNTTRTLAAKIFDNTLNAAAAGPLGKTYQPVQNYSQYVSTTPLSTTAGTTNTTKGTGVFNDFDGDNVSDVVAVLGNGNLGLYRTVKGTSTTAPKELNDVILGKQFYNQNWVSPIPDVNGDGWPDIISRGTDGTMWMMLSTGKKTFANPVKFGGAGWGSMSKMTVSPDTNSDGKPEILAVRSDGNLYRYALSKTGVGTAQQIGQNWTGIKDVLAVSDMSGDGKPDVIGITTTGDMYLYTTSSTGVLTNATLIGHGWTTMDSAFIPGDLDGDGKFDLIGRRSDGNLYYYKNLGKSWGAAVQIDHGWGGIKEIS